MSIIISLVIFGIIVLVHEWGHFIAARKSGILVEEFAIGMGPKLFGVQKGDTLYTVRLLPIGGYCKMLGEDGADDDPRAFNNKPIYKRVLVVIAGAFMNFLLSIFIFGSINFFILGVSLPIISSVVDGSAAAKSELAVGDEIIKINGSKIYTFYDLTYNVNKSNGNQIEIQYKRNGVKYTTNTTPQLVDDEYKIGIVATALRGAIDLPSNESQNANDNSSNDLDKAGLFQSYANGFWEVTHWVKITIDGIAGLINKSISLDKISGPIGVVSFVGDIYNETKESALIVIVSMAKFAAVLSVSIGAFNLLPIPALDGGRLIFLIIEAIRRKPITSEIEGKVHFVGFILLMGIAALVAFKDILKIAF
jgi:regulator of sigma E protease